MESHLQGRTDNKGSHPAASPDPDRDAQFLAMLPRIRRQAGYYLRHLSTEERAEGIQEVVANAFVSWVRLTERGKSDLAYAGPLARYGAFQYFGGRRVGNRMSVGDVASNYCQQSKGILVGQLDCCDEPTGQWQEILVEDRHSGPAEVATARIDFAAWLESLPERTRQVAEALASGEATSHVAQMFGCSASRVSQLRRELHQAWRAFQGEAVALPISA
jgi:DNA-directed RNA polymerase specialized sigma24 family protein